MCPPDDRRTSFTVLMKALAGDAPVPDSIEPSALDRIREVALHLPSDSHSLFLRLDLIERRSPEEIIGLLGLSSLRAFKRRKRQAFAALRDALLGSF